jgi:tetratricopeptide (TPR) repeat protein
MAAAGCFTAAVASLAWSWADLTISAVRAPDNPKRLSQMTPQRWREAVDRLYQARALDPLNARFPAELGRHYAWLSLRSSGVAEAARDYRLRSGAAYAEAIDCRPTWGYAWANYAEARLLAGAGGEQTREALERALTLAPWETGTQTKSLLVAFAIWDDLNESQRAMTVAMLRRALSAGDDLDLVLRLAVNAGKASLAESMLRPGRQRELLRRIVAQSDR